MDWLRIFFFDFKRKKKMKMEKNKKNFFRSSCVCFEFPMQKQTQFIESDKKKLNSLNCAFLEV